VVEACELLHSSDAARSCLLQAPSSTWRTLTACCLSGAPWRLVLTSLLELRL
jgi:hypothetical protein